MRDVISKHLKMQDVISKHLKMRDVISGYQQLFSAASSIYADDTLAPHNCNMPQPPPNVHPEMAVMKP